MAISIIRNDTLKIKMERAKTESQSNEIRIMKIAKTRRVTQHIAHGSYIAMFVIG